MALLAPPSGVRPERLWRILSRTPRPWLPIDLNIIGAPEGCRVVAGTQDQEAEVLSLSMGDSSHSQTYRLERTALALHDEQGRRFFRSGEHLAKTLDRVSSDILTGRVLEALYVCAPNQILIDRPAWISVLQKGAKEALNHYRALSMARCEDPPGMTIRPKDGKQVGFAARPRPDLFYGLPPEQLTDGQMLAFDAARKAFK